MNKTILFISNAIQFAQRQLPIGNEFEKRGYTVNYVTYSKECEKFFAKHGKQSTNMVNKMSSYNLTKPVIEYLENFEEKYNIPSINLLLFADRNYTCKPRDKALEGIARHFIFWEEYLSQNKVDFILGGAERLVNSVPRIVGPNFGARQINYRTQPILDTFVMTERQDCWSGLQEYWSNNKARSLTADEQKKVTDYINNMTKNKQRIYNVFKPPKLGLTELKLFTKRMWTNLTVESWKNPYADLGRITKEQISRIFRKPLAKLKYEKPNYDEKYIYYPMHRPIDAALLLRAPHFVDQASLIETLARHIPVGYKLYVKEHPSGKGEAKLSELNRIKALPNVKLLDPDTHSHDLIKNSACIITVNSNTGWEAMLYQKPVVTLGNAFFDISGVVNKVINFYDLAPTIKKALKQKSYDAELMHRFINATMAIVYPGQALFIGKYSEGLYDKKNISTIVDGMEKYFASI